MTTTRITQQEKKIWKIRRLLAYLNNQVATPEIKTAIGLCYDAAQAAEQEWNAWNEDRQDYITWTDITPHPTQLALKRYNSKWSGDTPAAAECRRLYAEAVQGHTNAYGVRLQDYALRLLGDPTSKAWGTALTREAQAWIDFMQAGIEWNHYELEEACTQTYCKAEAAQ